MPSTERGRGTPTIPSLMAAAEAGDRSASAALFEALYTELHGLARRELRRAGPSTTLGVTTLLHEAYLDMAARSGPSFPDRARFMTYAARVMRGLIIETMETVQTTDPGRAMITGKWADIGKFKGPTLRALPARAPYFHNGSAATLADVVDFYNTRFHIGLTAQEKADLIAFLRVL